MTTYIFPPEAIPVRDYIREHVERPERLPYRYDGNNHLRFSRGIQGHCCPLGMLDEAKAPVPAYPYDWPKDFPFPFEQIKLFAKAWDRFTKPQAAVDAVWGEQ